MYAERTASHYKMVKGIDMHRRFKLIPFRCSLDKSQDVLHLSPRDHDVRDYREENDIERAKLIRPFKSCSLICYIYTALFVLKYR